MAPRIKNLITLHRMITFGQRVRAAREAAGLSQSQLAKKLGGLKQPTIHNIETNPKVTSSKHTLSIARITNVRTEWLETGEGPMIPGKTREIDNSTQKSEDPLTTPELNIKQWDRDVPVLGLASCGEDGVFELNGQVLDHVRRPPRLAGAKGIYAVYIDGESMFPWREPGDLAYVNPHHPIKIGDYVLVEMHPDKPGDTVRRAYVKRLVRRTAEKLVLSQFNPPEEKTLPAKRVKSVHRIIPWSELLGI